MTALQMKADPEHVPGVLTATIAADENNVNVRISDQGRLINLESDGSTAIPNVSLLLIL